MTRKPFARARALALIVTVATLASAPARANHQAPPPVGAACFLVADKGDYPGDRDLLTLLDTGKTQPQNESAIGFTGTLSLEALAMRPSDGKLFGLEGPALGTLDEHTGAFRALTGADLGSGSGSLGTQTFKSSSGLSFDPTDGSLYVAIRKGSGRQDLLIKVDPATGRHVNDAFGAGADYVAVPAPDGLDDIDDLSFDAGGRLWAVVNGAATYSMLVRIDRSTGKLDGSYAPKRVTGHADATDLEGLAWAVENGAPVLFGVNVTSTSNLLWKIDPSTGAVTSPRAQLGASPGTTTARDYEGVVCGRAPSCAQASAAKPALGGTGTPQTMTIDLSSCVGAIAGVRPAITVTPAADEVANTCESPGTDAAGRCTVTLRSTNGASTTTVAAAASGTANGKPFTFATTMRLAWIATSVCLDAAAGSLPIMTAFTIPDTDPQTAGPQGLTDVTVTAELATGLSVTSAERIAGVTPVVSGTPPRVRYRFASLAPGTYSARVFTVPASDLPDPTSVTNRLVLETTTATGSVARAHTFVITNDARARAFGVTADALGGAYVLGDQLSPDSDTGRTELVSVPNPIPGASTPLARAVAVSESQTTAADRASSNAVASAMQVDVTIPGVVRVQADAVVARASTTASSNGAPSSAVGSIVANLRIDGVRYGDISEPTTIDLGEVGGAPLVEVHVLERAPAMSGTSGMNAGTLEVNGLRVVVRDLSSTPADESSEIVVAHAESAAEFGPTVDCRGTPGTAAEATIMQLLDTGVAADAVVGRVMLPGADGSVEEHTAMIELPIGRARSLTSSVVGTIASSPERADVGADARIGRSSLASGALTFSTIEASADCSLVGCTGDTTIANLVVGGTAVCTALGLASTCEPAPNTALLLPSPGPVLVVLNEHVAEPNGLLVNAVHVFVLGRGNPLGLPAGADLTIGSARAYARPSS